jgi:hypothetical protein
MDKNRLYLLSANMGYGHHRAAYGVKDLGKDSEVIEINSYLDEAAPETKLWELIRFGYELVSRLKRVPLVGNYLFNFLDMVLNIPTLYSKKDFSEPSINVKWIRSLLKMGLLKDLFDEIKGSDGVVLTSFYLPMLAAEYYKVKHCYCIICDSDLNRVWVPFNPSYKNITYFVPCDNAYRRLKRSGVSKKQIYRTGFPIDQRLLGDQTLSLMMSRVSKRLAKLDRSRIFYHYRRADLKRIVGEKYYSEFKEYLEEDRKDPIVITYAIGGAGAQKEDLKPILLSFRKGLTSGDFKFNIVAGIREDVISYCKGLLKDYPQFRDAISIIYGNSFEEYYNNFTNVLCETDILWTKPSELSFFVSLGIPIIMNTPIGSQEDYNKRWLLELGAAIPQKSRIYVDEWMDLLLKKGKLAEAAWNGFLKGRKLGYYKIKDIISKDQFIESRDPLKR